MGLIKEKYCCKRLILDDFTLSYEPNGDNAVLLCAFNNAVMAMLNLISCCLLTIKLVKEAFLPYKSGKWIQLHGSSSSNGNIVITYTRMRANICRGKSFILSWDKTTVILSDIEKLDLTSGMVRWIYLFTLHPFWQVITLSFHKGIQVSYNLVQ